MFLGTVFTFNTVRADSAASPSPEQQQVTTPVKVDLAARLEAKFYAGLNSVSDKQFEKATAHFKELGEEAHKAGYLNLPQFSIELIEKARQEARSGRRAQAEYFISQAVGLSPEDAQVHLIAASFHGILPGSSTLGYLLTGISLLSRSPSTTVPFLLNFLILGLMGTTLGLLVLCVVQIACYGEAILVGMSRIVPLPLRGLAGPVSFLVLLFIPPLFGIFAALACWTLVLGRFVRHCRALPLVCGILVVAWGAMLPLIDSLSARVQSRAILAFERINNAGFSSGDRDEIIRAFNAHPSNPFLLFAFGHVLKGEGRLDEAERVYLRTLNLTTSGSYLNRAALVNLAAVKHLQGQDGEAKEILVKAETQGEQGFELLYNMAQVNLNLLEMEGYRKYYNRLKDLDGERLSIIESKLAPLGETVKYALLAPVSSGAVYGNILAGDGLLGLSKPLGYEKSDRLARQMLAGGSCLKLIILGVVVLMLALFAAKNRYEAAALERFVSTSSKPSFVWLFMPAGMYLAGRQPLRGLILLSILIGLVSAGLGKPIELLSILPTALYRDGLSLYLALFLLVGITLLGSLTVRNGAVENGEAS